IDIVRLEPAVMSRPRYREILEIGKANIRMGTVAECEAVSRVERIGPGDVEKQRVAAVAAGDYIAVRQGCLGAEHLGCTVYKRHMIRAGGEGERSRVDRDVPVSYTHLRAHETGRNLV